MRVTCSHCGHRFQVRDDAAGKRGKCPNAACRQVILVPLIQDVEEILDVEVIEEAEPVERRPQPSPRMPQKRTSATQRPSKSVMREPQYKAVQPVRAAAPSVAKKKKKSKKRSEGPSLTSMIVGSALFFVVIAGVLIARSWNSGSEAQASAAIADADAKNAVPAANYASDLGPFIHKYCGECHESGSNAGDFAFDRYRNLDEIKADRVIWGKVLKLMKVGAMPPPDSAQPTAEEMAKAIGWLDHQLFYVDCNVEQNFGRVVIRRLNRTEYNNTVNDLMAIDFQPANDFPSDDVGHGFDNIGEVLSVPPLLMEKYLAAAEAISVKVVPAGSPVYENRIVNGGSMKSEDKAAHSNGEVMGLVSRATAKHEFNVPRAGKYKFTIAARQDRAGDEDAKMVVTFGGKELKTISVARRNGFDRFSFDLDLPAGKQVVTAAFINDFYNEKAEKEKDRNLHIRSVELEGPFGISPEEREKLLLSKIVPKEGVSVEQAARENIQGFLPRAFRRPVSDVEITRYVGLVKMTVDRGETFEEGMRTALQAILISPHFLFRVEGGRRVEGNVEFLDDYALASRLSYFIWSSMPDDELMELAKQGKLHEPDVLRQQTERLLQDPRSRELIQNFPGQWLGLRKLTTSEVDPNAQLFPQFTQEIRKDLWKETELFFDSVVRSNSSIYDLLDGKYTFLNERLAKYYEIPNVSGQEFRRVDLSGQPRAGVLTHGSILTLTSFPDRTSPVKRGEWVMSNLLGDAPPEAPPSVPALEETSTKNPNLTFRQKLELHRADPGCASCHKEMDAIGFGMQNFDAIGRFRELENKQPIDASGVLPSGESFNGSLELLGVLRKHKAKFGRCLTEKMMTFALGRGVEWFDRCAIDSIMSDLERDDRMSTLIFGIVTSGPFQARKLVSPAAESTESLMTSK
ncbi:DUF1592 domain-containing protein [Planctomicrobium sp. SH527]|uniref:DUF1592 domain-containing protein n=1 Tax=Planctomicrobium sp. SH527 TaxID=3448123 RepID=UPI003F5C72BD